MLEAQLQLRRNMQARSRKVAATEEDEGVIYIEGEEEGDTIVKSQVAKGAVNGKKLSNTFDDSEDDEAMANGVDSSEMGEEEVDLDSADEEDADLIDDEAEESDAESDELSDENIDYDDIDDEDMSGSGEEEIEEDLPPKNTKAKKVSRH